MSRAELLSTSASVEKAACLLALLILGGLYAWSRRRDALSTDRVEELNLSRVGEGLALLSILLLAVVLRVVKWDEGIPGTVYAGEVITARADILMRRGGFLSHWWSLLRQPNPGGTLYDSVISGLGRLVTYRLGSMATLVAAGAAAASFRTVSGNTTFWALFIVFVLGPCEPLIPLFMVPACHER